MAKPTKKTIDALKKMLAKQLEIESDWYSVKHEIAGVEKDPISAALTKCKDLLQFAVDDLSK